MGIQNFTYYIPTKIHFGKGQVAKIANEIPKGVSVMLLYGTGSIKENGIYEQVIGALAGYRVIEFAGINQNPDVIFLEKAIKIAKKEKVGYLLAVGGGSVLDAAKFISAAFYHKGPAWDLVSKKLPIEQTLPLGTVLTLPATSSEMNYISVLSNSTTKEKYSIRHPNLFPTFSVIDPGHTYSLSKKQLGYGICDAFLHVMEQYINTTNDALLQDGVSETLLRILIEEGPKALALDKPDYTNRANLAWTQAWCLNGMVQTGVPTDLATHKVGHELTALYNVTHAPSLVLTYPSVLKMVKTLRPKKLLKYARNVWGIVETDEDLSMNLAIEKTIQFFNDMGISHRYVDYDLPIEAIDVVTERFIERGWNYIGNMQDVDVRALRDQIKKDQSAWS